MFQVSHRVTTKQKPIVGTNKIKMRESKYTTMKNHQFTKEDSKRGNKNKGGTKQLENN